jgi:hypothetical protein
MKKPKTIPELIDAFGGTSKFGTVIGKGQSTASEMKRSGSIKVEYWPLIVAAAGKSGVPNVTFESLAEMCLEKFRQMHGDEHAA